MVRQHHATSHQRPAKGAPRSRELRQARRAEGRAVDAAPPQPKQGEGQAEFAVQSGKHHMLINWHAEYAQLRGLWREHPVLYAKQRLGLNPTHQQRDLLRAIAEPGARVTVRSGHSTGKSTAMAAAIWWKLECFDFAKIPCTAPSAGQLRDILWAELAKWFRESIVTSKAAGMPPDFWLSNLFEVTQDKVFAKGAPKEWFAVARTSRPETPDALQGFHASNIRISDDGLSIVENHNSGTRGQIMFVIDEAAGVADIVFEVAEGALASPNSSLLMGGNPTRGTGYFAASHKHNRADYTCLHFKSSDSPLVADGYRDGLVRKFGEGSNVVRVRADGEFPRADDDTLIPLDLVEAAISRERDPGIGQQRRLGIDVARYGDDRTVFTLRAGPNVEKVKIAAKLSLMETAGIAVQLIKQWKANAVFVDVVGMGSGLFDRLVEMRRELDDAGQPKIHTNVQLVEVNVATKAPDRAVQVLETESQPYKLRDYLWLEVSKWLREEEPSFAGLDQDIAQDLAGELCSVRFEIDSSGRTVIESKDKMKKRGLRSCDLADSLAATFYPSGIMGKGAAIFEIMRREAEEIRRLSA